MDVTNSFRGEFEVTVRNKKIKGAFTMNAIRLVMRNEKMKLEDFDKYLTEDPLTAIPTIGYFSCVSEAVKSGKELKIGKEQFIAEVLDNGGMDSISEALTHAMGADETSGND